jgi:hypothetical protein
VTLRSASSVAAVDRVTKSAAASRSSRMVSTSAIFDRASAVRTAGMTLFGFCLE